VGELLDPPDLGSGSVKRVRVGFSPHRPEKKYK